MAIIQNPNAILNGYVIEFPTVGFVKSHFQLDITPADQNQLGYPRFIVNKAKAGTVFCKIQGILGFDVPVLIKTKEKCKGSIAILGQDALRDLKDPLLEDFNTKDDIAIGLPYAIAYDHNYKQVSVYHNLVKDILDAGYDVYLTDIWKSWDKDHNSRMGKWSKNNPHNRCSDDEFESVNIDYVVLMGNVAQNKFKTITTPNSVVEIPVPHLSPAANGTWKDILKGKPVEEANKIEFVKGEMKKKGVKI